MHYDSRQGKAAGWIRKSCDQAHHGIIKDIPPHDAKAQWEALIDHYEKKSVGNRFFATQNLLSLCCGSEGHKDETYSDFASQAIVAANALKNLLPEGATISPPNTTATLNHGFTAADLVNEMTISAMIIGIGDSKEDQVLKSTLIHMGLKTLEDIVTEFRKADTLIQSNALANGSESALAAKGRNRRNQPRSPAPGPNSSSTTVYYWCDKHQKNTTHTTNECCVLNGQGKGKGNKLQRQRQRHYWQWKGKEPGVIVR